MVQSNLTKQLSLSVPVCVFQDVKQGWIKCAKHLSVCGNFFEG